MTTVSDYLCSRFGLVGKTALITGGTRGIGAALSVALASAGADIILLQRNTSSGSDVKAAVESLGRRCTTYECDLGQKGDRADIIKRICTDDRRKVDILINCAGISHRSPAIDYPDARWDEIMQVNVAAAFQLSRALAKHWLEAPAQSTPKQLTNAKKIINIASILSFTGSYGVSAYATSKGAIAQLTKALSNEWMGKGICITALAPGYITTELTKGYSPDAQRLILERTPAGRMGVPEDLAGAVVYLASRASDFVSGEIHVVDGGFCGR